MVSPTSRNSGRARQHGLGHLDHQAVEQLFGVVERRARQLMAGLPASALARVGTANAVEDFPDGGGLASSYGHMTCQWHFHSFGADWANLTRCTMRPMSIAVLTPQMQSSDGMSGFIDTREQNFARHIHQPKFVDKRPLLITGHCQDVMRVNGHS